MNIYKQGDILRPTQAHTGYCQIWSVQVIPEGRLAYYSEDGSVDKIYHVYTDFGNYFPLTGKEITSGYEVVGNECVRERVARWQEGVMRVVELVSALVEESGSE